MSVETALQALRLEPRFMRNIARWEITPARPARYASFPSDLNPRLIEALTAGLTGFGRADPPEGWGATVFVQVLDPQAFGGRDAFLRQTQWLADACHAATPRPDAGRVRLPGERGLALMRMQSADGVLLHASILPALLPWAQKLGVPVPAALGNA